MRTLEDTKKRKVKLERKLDRLYKYRNKINFTNAYDVRASSSEYDEYTKEILLIEGSVKSLSWVLDEDF